ncbi:MAG: hypothetical protein ACU0E9_01470 [Limimaricola soesokkakensis]|uniref:hypothetical protein n=1 Tax=Limimaricola soesokkakensis TaxID=1343159 RepID=UPI004059E986
MKHYNLTSDALPQPDVRQVRTERDRPLLRGVVLVLSCLLTAVFYTWIGTLLLGGHASLTAYLVASVIGAMAGAVLSAALR